MPELDSLGARAHDATLVLGMRWVARCRTELPGSPGSQKA